MAKWHHEDKSTNRTPTGMDRLHGNPAGVICVFCPSSLMAAKASPIVSIATEICSASDVKPVMMVHVRKADSPAPKHAVHGEDCPYCRVHGDTVYLPMTAELDPFLLIDLFPLPSLFYHSPRPLFAWTAAQPRGPPAKL